MKGKYWSSCTWDQVAHLDEATKKSLWDSLPIHEREARSKGIPTIGTGKIYPVDMETILIDPFKIPDYWAKGFGMDIGWNRTAVIWGALDREDDVLYLYSEYYVAEAPPVVHASAIKARGDMVGFIDPASRGRSQHDGQQILQMYRDEGLTLLIADNAVEAGIYEVYQRMISGRLRIFSTLQNFQKELSLYHRGEDGKVVKKADHLCDAARYCCMATSQMGYATSSKQGHYATTNGGVTYLTSRPKKAYR